MIGTVRSAFSDSRSAPRQSRLAPRSPGLIVVDAPFRPGLEELLGFDYLWVVAVLDGPPDPPGGPDPDRPLLRSDGREASLLASRRPFGASTISLTLSELVRVDVETGTLEVRGIDLADGTPVVDLKPYVPAFDRPQVGVPVAAGRYDWVHLEAPLPIEASREEAVEAAERWRRASTPFVVVQPLHLRGAGVRAGGELCVATGSEVGGDLLAGAVLREEVLTLARRALEAPGATVASMRVDTAWGARHALGLAPEVSAVASSGLELPGRWWECLRTGIPVALAVTLDGAPRVAVFEQGGASGPLAESSDVHDAAAQLLELRYESGRVLDAPHVAIQTFFPTPTLVLAGWQALGGVIAEIARPMGWRCRTAPDPDEAVALSRELGWRDALIVMGHDPALDEPVLEAALRPGGPSFVAALGSAFVARDRKQRLAARGIAEAEIARLRSPAGLPIGGRTAPEIALSVVAELQAARYGS